MTLHYSTATSGDRALGEIQRILQNFGCSKFGVMTDTETGLMTFEDVFMPHMLLPDGKRFVEHGRKMLRLEDRSGT